MTSNKRVFITVAISSILFIIICCGLYRIVNGKVLLKSYSINDEHVIIIRTKESFLFGPTYTRIISKSTGVKGLFDYKNRKETIHNDGGTLYEDNVKIKWTNDEEATVILDGCEQLPKTIKIVF